MLFVFLFKKLLYYSGRHWRILNKCFSCVVSDRGRGGDLVRWWHYRFFFFCRLPPPPLFPFLSSFLPSYEAPRVAQSKHGQNYNLHSTSVGSATSEAETLRYAPLAMVSPFHTRLLVKKSLIHLLPRLSAVQRYFLSVFFRETWFECNGTSFFTHWRNVRNQTKRRQEKETS